MLNLRDVLLFLSDSAPEEVDLNDPEQVALEARRLALIAEIQQMGLPPADEDADESMPVVAVLRGGEATQTKP